MAEVEGTEKRDRIGVGAASRGVLGTATDEEDFVTGRLGNDRIEAGAGADRVWADRSGSLASGRPANDVVFGEAGDDVLFGDAEILLGAVRGGRDLLDGGDGADTILGDASVLRERSGVGSDLLIGGRATTRSSGMRENSATKCGVAPTGSWAARVTICSRATGFSSIRQRGPVATCSTVVTGRIGSGAGAAATI